MDKGNIYQGYTVIRREGMPVPFDRERIVNALKANYIDVHKGHVGDWMHDKADRHADAVCAMLMRDKTRTSFHVEDIQDMVELSLMRAGEREEARGFVVFRDQRAQERAVKSATAHQHQIHYVEAGERVPFNVEALAEEIKEACAGITVDAMALAQQASRVIYDGMSKAELDKGAYMTARTWIEKAPEYDRVAAQLTIKETYAEVLGEKLPHADRAEATRAAFKRLLQEGVNERLFKPDLLKFDLARLAAALDFSRDALYSSAGILTLYDRYLVKNPGGRRIEVAQTFFMRVAMGMALGEIEREEKAIEFYNVLSQFDFLSSTPTLFNAGLIRSQMSSCFLTTVPDDLDGIYDAYKENALLSKYAGGLGNDWTKVRALGSYIAGTNGKSQGVVPFLKVSDVSTVAVNQGGKRAGAVCAYLETWHLDIEEFLDLRKNTGDDRRRTPDMHTANWIPDLFVQRALNKGQWTLFSPEEVPELHELTGQAFKAKYEAYEAKAAAGGIRMFKVVDAEDLWKRMLGRLFETGHPWITFKDACNIRSPQQHCGVVHSSNLCTEITLNTSDEETAVCNIGSVNLATHIKDGKLDVEKLARTVRTAMRMLDNVIDVNFYNSSKARVANMRHRPVGIGMMGFNDCLNQMRISYASEEAMVFADQSAEALCYFAYEASSDLAAERGAYKTYKGSLWSQGILPQDTLAMLSREREQDIIIEGDLVGTMPWDALRVKIAAQGMRNSNCVAIAPTATISLIASTDASIEPCFTNLSVKSTMSGEFTVPNKYMVNDLRAIGAWDEVMLADLKHCDGSVARIERVPQELKNLYLTAFEVDALWLIKAAARRGKWIDQAQSLNIYLYGASGKKLREIYEGAWLRGLKTTYYLRTMAAAQAEKSTGRGGELNAVHSGGSQVGEAAVCEYRPGDPNRDSCQVCQ